MHRIDVKRRNTANESDVLKRRDDSFFPYQLIISHCVSIDADIVHFPNIHIYNLYIFEPVDVCCHAHRAYPLKSILK